MTSIFKCLVELNDIKYKIIINNGINSITFNDMLNELLNIKQFTNISHQTHYFEIFDTDFSEYVLITSDSQFIDNLSRIRVRPKPHLNHNSRKDTTHFVCAQDNNKGSQQTHQIDHNTVDDNYRTIDNWQTITTESGNKTKNKSINNNNNENKRYYNNYSVCLFMIQLINSNKHQFKTRLKKNFRLLSNKMKENGFNQFDAKLCKSYFTSIHGLYIEILSSSVNYKVACDKDPLFEVIHKSYDNFHPLVGPSYDMYLKLRKKFIDSENNDNVPGNNCKSTSDQSVNNNTSNPIHDESNQSFPALNAVKQSLEVITKQVNNSCSTPNVSYSSIDEHKNRLECQQREQVVESENWANTNINLYQTLINNKLQFTSDSILIDTIANFCAYLETIDQSILWQLVTIRMIRCGFIQSSIHTCLTRFHALICRYFQVLSTTDFQRATIEFPLFPKLNSINVSYPFLFPYIHQSLNQTNSFPLRPFVQNYVEFKKQIISKQPNTLMTSEPNSPMVNAKSEPKTTISNSISWTVTRFADEDEVPFKIIELDNKRIIYSILNANDVNEQIKLFCDQILLKEGDIISRFELRDKLQQILSENGFNCVLHIFGSTLNKLGFRNSDIDIFIELPEKSNVIEKIHNLKAEIHLETIRRILTQSLGFVIQEPIAKPLMRCPLIRVNFSDMNRRLRNNGITCDINFSSALSLQNTKLICLFCEIEPRFQVLTSILRYWAKLNGLIGSEQFTSYAFTQLVIFFCQNLNPPLLPSVDYLRQLTKTSLIINGWECGFCDNKDLIKKSLNKQTIIELLVDFFKFYSNFDFYSEIICTKIGLSKQKDIIFAENTYKLDITPFCCIEDPFDLNHNLTERLGEKPFDKFVTYAKHIDMNCDHYINSMAKGSHYWGIARMLTQLNGCISREKSILIRRSFVISYEMILDLTEKLTYLTQILLKDVYYIECTIIDRYSAAVNKLSPFVEFDMNLDTVDSKVIAKKKRKSIRKIVAKIIDRFKSEKLTQNFNLVYNSDQNTVEDRFRFKLLVNACISCPLIKVEVIYAKPSILITNIIECISKLIDVIIAEIYAK